MMPGLLLKYDPADVPPGGSEVICCLAAPLKYLSYEPAGHSFHEAALLLAGFVKEQEAVVPESTSKEATAGIDPSSWQSGRRKKAADKSGKTEQDHYALLGLSHLRYLATEDQIKKAYREVALKNHPDKQAALLLNEETEEAKELKREEIDNHFKTIQAAYDTLTDPVRRRVYDSTDEFDDEIPSECAPEDFFKVFGPVFMRNARWSSLAPVPTLGDADTAIEEVDKMYDFWFAFKSWREFPQEDEFELDQAESREHKRWMERQNAKLREKAKKEENSRVRELVENAYRKDPRILKRKEDEKAEKERKKQAKKNAKKEKEDEEKRVAEEERRRKEEEEKKQAEEAAIIKKQKEKEKKALRKEKQRLRTVAAPCLSPATHGSGSKKGSISSSDLEDFCATLDFEQVKALSDRMEQEENVDKRKRILLEAVGCSSSEAVEGAVSDEGQANGRPGGPSTGTGESGDTSSKTKSSVVLPANSVFVAKKEERPWERAELELLRKAVTKFPKGTSQRWEVISNYIGTGRTVDEILKAVKQDLLKKPDDSNAFASFLTKRKTVAEIASPLSMRDELTPPPPAVVAAATTGAGQEEEDKASSSASGSTASSAAGSSTATAVAKSASQANGHPLAAAATATKKGGESSVATASIGKPGMGTRTGPGVAANGKAAAAAIPAANGVVGHSPTPGSGESGEAGAEEDVGGGSAAAADGVAEESGAGALPPAKAAGATAADPWTEVEQIALVRALKAFPKDTEKRWDRIAAAVPGKSKSQCFKRFAFMRETFRQKKGAETVGE